MLKGFPPQIIWLRVGNSKIEIAEAALKRYRDKVNDLINEDVVGLFEIRN